MWFGCVLRSVGRRMPFQSNINSRCFIMAGTKFEEFVFSPTGTKFISTMENSNPVNGNCKIDEEYEEAIKSLNSLQSNAETIRRSIDYNNREIPLADTVKYLHRSGLCLDKLEKLSFIHVSGTKGKGSTCALTESILRAHGVKTGFFSSPHLVSVTERIRINGEPIAKHKFINAFWRVFNRLQEAQESATDMPSYFKFLTILCFHIFLEEQVDVTVLEVGIGGELDSTNIIRNTKTVGITSLALEHTQLLGNTLQEIAWQKAGIIKPYANVYTSAKQPECLEVIKKRAEEKNATVHIVPDFTDYIKQAKLQQLSTNLNDVTKLNGSLAINLAYDWLSQNNNEYHQNSAISNKQLTERVWNALINSNWPGRCQTVKFLNFNVHLDGAHTIESMHVCSDWFFKSVENSHKPKILIFNTTGERDSQKLLSILRNKSQFQLACFVPNIPSSNENCNDVHSVLSDSSEQRQRAKQQAVNWSSLCAKSNEVDNSQSFDSILDSFNFIQKRFGVEQELDVLVTGSLRLIGATVLALNEFKDSSVQT